MSSPNAKTVRTETAAVMARATNSAIDLGNFPLGSVDVQCAFDSWSQEWEHTQTIRLYPEYVSELKARVQFNLFALGFTF